MQITNIVIPVMLFSIFPYLYYIKRNPAFIFVAIFIALPCSFCMYFLYKDIIASIKKYNENCKYHFIMFFIALCLSIIGVIIVLLSCI